MEFVADYWFVWLFAFLVSTSIFFVVHVRTVKSLEPPPWGIFGLLAFVANGSIILLAIAIIVKIIQYAVQVGG